jgi:hypothetical protein
MRHWYPGTGRPLLPGRMSPSRFEMKMWKFSVDPMPSMMSIPVRSLKAYHTGAGSASPADTPSRSEPRSYVSEKPSIASIDAYPVGAL